MDLFSGMYALKLIGLNIYCAGYSSFKMFFFLVAPLFFCLYFAAVVAFQHAHGGNLILHNPFKDWDEHLPPIRIFMLQRMFLASCVGSIMGIMMILTNSLSESNYDDFCFDPLMRTTTSLLVGKNPIHGQHYSSHTSVLLA